MTSLGASCPSCHGKSGADALIRCRLYPAVVKDNQKLMLTVGVGVDLVVAAMLILTSGVLAAIFDPEPEASLRKIFSMT